ncbi:unnamed protein product [Schistocephalus solidus]|uniref:DUF7083 domain-containing protein n=1 Tax=Schistocephalus solidus TaxID=70667 RepID=A0A183T4X0_SCHSO|nr:unnamed protein product [Schistocephalus solidus]
MMECMMQQFSLHFHDPEPSGKQSKSAGTVAVCITEFIYDPDSGVPFDAWFKRWKVIFHVEFAIADDAWKVRLLLRNLGTKVCERYTGMLLRKNPHDFLMLASIVNRKCETFKLRTMTENQFKCLIFVCAHQSPRDAQIRTRLLSKIEQDPDSTLQTLTAEFWRLKNLKHAFAIVEQPSSSLAATNVYAVTHKK